MKKLVMLLMLFVLAPAVNADTFLTVHGLSIHIESNTTFNETQPGLGITWGDKWYGTAGFYKNSLARQSVYAGVGYAQPLITMGPIQTTVGGTALIASGYYVPIAVIILMPTLTIGVDRAQLIVGYIPKVTKWPAVVTFSLQIKLN